MTTPRDPGRSVRGGQPARGGDAGQPATNEPWRGEEGPDDRWTPEDRYVIEREPRIPRRDDGERWEPPARRGRSLWASAALAALLGAILVALVVVAAVVLPGLTGPAPSSAPSPSAAASATLIAGSPTPSITPSPSATPSATPLPSVLEVEVQPGDSLNSIADRYGTHPRSIAFWNRDRYPSLDPQSPAYEPDNIQIGWTLVVYPGETFPEPSTTPATSGVAPSPAVSAAP